MSDLKEVISLIKSCLLSSKGITPIENLNRDYKSLVGENIPHRRLGFSTLTELLNQPELRVYRRGDSVFVEAIATAETAHIASMVAKQRCKTKRKRRPLGNFAVKSRMPIVSANTNISRIQPLLSLSPSPRNIPAHVNQRANTKPLNLPPRNSYQQPSRRQMSSPLPPTATNPSRILEHAKSITISSDNRSNRTVTSAPKNLSSPPMNREVNGKGASSYVSPRNLASPPMNREVNGKGASSHVSPPLPIQSLLSSQSLQQPRVSLSDRLARPPPLPIPNSSRNIREHTNIDRRVTFAVSDDKNIHPRTPPTVAPLPIIPSPKIQLSSQCKDPRDELLDLVRKLNLGEPEYKIFQHSKQNKINTKLCSVTVGTKKYSSYPSEAKTDEEAQKFAAVQAVLDINQNYTPIMQLEVTKDVEIIKQRIISIVDVHNGVLVEQLPVYYKSNYNEILPDDWCTFVRNCPKDLIFEESGVNKSLILWRYNETIHKPKESPISHANNIPSFIGEAVPADLILPTENLWAVRVQNVVSCSEIWVVIIEDDYSTRLVPMTAEISKHYTENKHQTKSIEVDGFYVVKDDGNWFRVQVVNINSDTKQADIFFIDTGDYDTVSYDQLYPLEKCFCDIPGQAIKLSLTGLEEFSDYNEASDLAEELLLYQHFYASINNREDVNDSSTLSATFYNTLGDDDVNVNDLLLQKLCKNSESSELCTEGHVTEVCISNIELDGDIFVQMKAEGLKIIAALINRVISPSLDVESFKKAAVDNNIDTTEIYLAKCPDGNWMRSKVIEILGGHKLKMLFIDFGGTIIVDINKLLRLRPLSPVLEKYPQQAHKVQLHNIEKSNFNEQMMNRLVELVPRNERLLCKVIKSANVPIVELFKRSQPDNVLISINNTLALIPEIDRNIEDGNNNIKPKKRLDRALSRCNSTENNGGLKCLRRPHIPKINDVFDVHVTGLAANPSNFIVQPYEDIASLTKMMLDLQNSCNDYTGPMLTSDSLREGKLCAAKYNDGWYRACINGIIDSQTVVVYLCDYGDMTPIGTEQLQPLRKEFTELPYQGIKSRLYGVEPINVDWTPFTCTMFQNLVANKSFASIVRNIEKDETSPTELILSLELIDVSTDVDIKIHEELVKDKQAILTVSE